MKRANAPAVPRFQAQPWRLLCAPTLFLQGKPFVRAAQFVALFTLGLILLASSTVQATEAPGVGARLDSLTVGTRHYEHIVVRGVTVRSISFTHSGGLASVPLRELPPELQARFGYSPEAERLADEQLLAARKGTEDRAARRKTPGSPKKEEEQVSKFERLLQDFGHPPALREKVDLRPRFRELSLGIKDQGRRPSCSVFAVVSALEFQNAELTGASQKFSEEYLIWAVRRTTQRSGAVPITEAAGDEPESPTQEDRDEGFSLPEVVAALRAYGIPPQASMPNTFGVKMEDILAPPPTVVAQARNHRKVFIHVIPGRDTATRLSNMIHALNTGVPVAIGLRWPHYRTVRAGFLSEQKPIFNYAHAVTIVGYQCDTDRAEDAVFLFKNSYGPSWGEAGYGRATYGYLRQHLLDGVILEVQQPGPQA